MAGNRMAAGPPHFGVCAIYPLTKRKTGSGRGRRRNSDRENVSMINLASGVVPSPTQKRVTYILNLMGLFPRGLRRQPEPFEAGKPLVQRAVQSQFPRVDLM